MKPTKAFIGLVAGLLVVALVCYWVVTAIISHGNSAETAYSGAASEARSESQPASVSNEGDMRQGLLVDPAAKNNRNIPVDFPTDRLSQIFANDETLPVLERLKMLKAIENPSAVEIAALYAFLGSDEHQTGLGIEQVYWLKNDLMTWLRYDDSAPQRYIVEMATLYRDADRDPVVRSYVLQHLAVWGEMGNDSEQVVETLFEASAPREGLIAGTALLGLSRLALDARLSDGEVRRIAGDSLKIAADESYSVESRVSALQVAGRHQTADAVGLAESIISDGKADPMLQISAIGVLRESGQSRHLQVLNELRAHSDSRIRRAANAAINSIR